MKKLRKQKYKIQKRTKPILELVWLDHCSGPNGWTHVNPEDAKLLVCHSVGYLIDETKDTYVLSGDFAQPPGIPWSRTMTVGKALIISKKVLG